MPARDLPLAPVSGPGAAEGRAWSHVIDDLLALRSLEDDWDGQGAVAPHPALVDGAIDFARVLRANVFRPADRASAGVNGTIFFEWHGPEIYQECEVVAPGEIEVRNVRTGSMGG